MEQGLKEAIKWINAELQDNPQARVGLLIDQASRQFNLTPLQTDFLYREYLWRSPLFVLHRVGDIDAGSVQRGEEAGEERRQQDEPGRGDEDGRGKRKEDRPAEGLLIDDVDQDEGQEETDDDTEDLRQKAQEPRLLKDHPEYLPARRSD